LESCSDDFERLWNYSIGFYAVWIAHVGRRMGMLARLADSPATASGLAATAGLYSPAVQAWCSAAIAYGFICKKNDGKLHLARNMKEMLLDAKNPDYLGGQFSYLALRSLEYASFDDLFKSGRTQDMASAFEAIQQATDWDHYAFLAATKKSKLHSLLLKGCRLLDVGCGTGSFLAKLHDKYPQSVFLGIDPSSEAVRMARKATKGKPIKILKQEGEAMKFSEEFDVVYLGESLYAAKDKQNVVSNCYRALKKGGILAILEGLLPESNLQINENRLILGMQLDFVLQGHRFMTAKEITRFLKATRFEKIQFTDMGGALYLVTAMR
jgi:ubiquinone/menaquinone biosynthesis C-methylase UbiE